MFPFSQRRVLVLRVKWHAQGHITCLRECHDLNLSALARSLGFLQFNSAKPESQIKKGWMGLPWWVSGKESSCLCRRRRFDPWSGRISQAAEQPSPCATAVAPVRQSLEPQLPSPCVVAEAQMPQSQSSAAREATATRSLHTTAKESSPHSPQLEKNLAAMKTQHSQK